MNRINEIPLEHIKATIIHDYKFHQEEAIRYQGILDHLTQHVNESIDSCDLNKIELDIMNNALNRYKIVISGHQAIVDNYNMRFGGVKK